MSESLNILEIERFALHDGPGIRTVVFLQGCPLRCPWCANPESQQPVHQLMHYRNRCVGCGACAESCPQEAIVMSSGAPVIDRARCNACGVCAESCLQNAMIVSGKQQSVEDVLAVVLRDRHYYVASNGGITVSGGEPFAQPAGLTALLRKAKAQGLHTAVETTGQVSEPLFLEALPLIDLFLFDLKHPDAAVLKRVTGGDLAVILKNLSLVAEHRAEDIVLRVPIIPGFNNAPDVILRIYALAQSYGIQRVDLLPYHRLGVEKYERLGLGYAFGDESALTRESLAPLQQLAKPFGLRVQIGG